MGDIDGMVERNGYFLWVETKRPNTPLSKGQSIMFEALAKKPDFTVIVIWGEVNKPEKLQYVGENTTHIADLDTVKKHFTDWYKRVDALPKYDPTQKTISKADVFAWIKEHKRDLSVIAPLRAILQELESVIVRSMDWINDKAA